MGAKTETPTKAHEAPVSLWLGPLLLAGAGLLIGLLPGMVADAVVAPALAAIAGKPVAVKLALWHGLNPMLLLSAITVGVGIGVYLIRDRLRKAALRLDKIPGPARGYSLSLDGLYRLAHTQTRILQNGYLRLYLLTIIATTIVLVGTTLLSRVSIDLSLVVGRTEIRFYELILAVVILTAAITAVRSPSRLATVAALGVVGYSISLIYVLFGAPDLAMTQFTVESLTVVLFVLVLYRLPRFARFTAARIRVRDVLVAILAGGLITLLVLATVANTPQSQLASYFIENSFPLAKGRNIVNVILVDFRGLDTMGEITVLAVAAIGVLALLKLGTGRDKD